MTNEGIKICAFEGFWLPLTVEIAGLAEAEGRDAGVPLTDNYTNLPSTLITRT
jgi:hypothetical protein